MPIERTRERAEIELQERIADTLDSILAAIQQARPDGTTLGQILQSITEGVSQIMKAIDDFAATVNKNFESVKAGIKALDDKITAFQNSPGTLSATDQAQLDAIVASSASLAAAANAVVPVVPPAA